MQSKRKSKGAFLALACALCFSGCRSEETEPVSITVIHAWGGTEDDHVAMRKIYEGFQHENPDVQLQLISMPGRDEMLRKVEDMIMVGNAPDIVAFGGAGKNEAYQFMLDNDMALDLAPYLKADPDLAASVSEPNLEYWTTPEGKLFSVADVLSLSGGYWYQTEMLEQAGVSEIPKTWDAFFEMCDALQRWAGKEQNGVKALQASAEGYLYFFDHIEADQRGEIQETLELLKKIYEFTASEEEDYTYRDETRLFNEGKLALYVNGVWGAPMIEEEMDVKYALLPTESGISRGCQSAGLGYVLGNSGDAAREEASVKFIKYMLSEEIQKSILEQTEQIPANAQVSLEQYEKTKARLYQAASLVLGAEEKIEVPDNIWTAGEKEIFTENILKVLTGELPKETIEALRNTGSA